MARTFVPLHFVATRTACEAFGQQLPGVVRAAYAEIGRLGLGYDVHHHAFRVLGRGVAVASRVTASGLVEIEIDVVETHLPSRTFSRGDARAALARLRRH